MKIVTTLHDPIGIYLKLINQNIKQLEPLCKNLFIAHTPNTSKQVLEKLKNMGAKTIMAGLYGESRIESIKLAENNNNESYFEICFDKLLHWLKIDHEDFNNILRKKNINDLIIIGRTRKAFDTYPKSWVQTESIINDLFSEKVGFEADPYACVNIFNHKVAKLLISNSKEKEWGSATEFPLIVYKKGLRIDTLWTDNLSWEDPDRFSKNDFELYGGFEKWKHAKYNRLKEWQHRTSSALEQLRVLNEYFPDNEEHRLK